MREVMIMLSKAAPEEFLLEELESSLQEYKLDKSQTNKNKFEMNLVMCTLRYITDNNSIEDVVSKAKETEEAMKLFERINKPSN